jgi:NDP-sugar pyrophosphorylase family protein
MKGMIFSAGLGTRLQQYTQNRPKALVEVNGKPLLWYAVRKLIDAGVGEIVINVHHFADQITDYLNSEKFDAKIIVSDERDMLLDTGGGLLKARHWLESDKPIIAYNVDVFSTVNLHEVIGFHQKHDALATLVVRNRQTSRYLMFDNNWALAGWKNTANGEQIIANEGFNHSEPFAFSGIQVLSPSIFEKISETGKFPIVQLYLRLAKTERIMGYLDESDFWLDCGKPVQLLMAEAWMKENGV